MCWWFFVSKFGLGLGTKTRPGPPNHERRGVTLLPCVPRFFRGLDARWIAIQMRIHRTKSDVLGSYMIHIARITSNLHKISSTADSSISSKRPFTSLRDALRRIPSGRAPWRVFSRLDRGGCWKSHFSVMTCPCLLGNSLVFAVKSQSLGCTCWGVEHTQV